MSDESVTQAPPTTADEDRPPLVFRDGATLTPAEVPAILDVIHRGLGDNSQHAVTFDPLCWFGKVIIAYRDGVPVCVVQGLRNWHDVTEMQLTTASVDPDYQGQGILRRTLAHLLEIVQRDAITQVAVHIPVDARPLFKVLVEQLGFGPQKWIDACYGPGQDRIYLVKSLIPGLR